MSAPPQSETPPLVSAADAAENGATPNSPPVSRWRGAWLDAAAFASGLGLAWGLDWQTTDLVWSLWLSSLVVGYATIVWTLSEPLRTAVADLRLQDPAEAGPASRTAALVLFGGIMLLGIGFFTVHFGLFHFVHSVFLNVFFPVTGGSPGGWVTKATYLEVVRRYWCFLPAAIIAERHGFRTARLDNAAPVEFTRPAIRERLAVSDGLAAPYRNVMRMHGLIFFFAFAHFARLENFAVFAVVYAVYFFPWRLLRRGAGAEPGACSR